jgi:hypothetical protein
MAAITWSGTKIFIATGASANSAPANQAAWEALTWTEVEQVVEIGEYGDATSIITTKILGSGRTIKLTGNADAGDVAVTILTDMLLAGQTAFRTASSEANRKIRHNFKIVEPDRADANDTDTTTYFGALVAAGRKSATSEGGDTDRRRSYTLAVTTPYLEVPTTVVP